MFRELCLCSVLLVFVFFELEIVDLVGVCVLVLVVPV